MLFRSAAVTITPEGTGSETAQGDITGTAALTFDATAAALGAGRLAGVAANAFTSSMFTGSVQPISGVASVVFTVTGALRNLSSGITTPRSRTVLVNNRRRR